MSASAEHLTDQPPDGVTAGSAKGHTRPSTMYPKHTLEDALKVPQAIEDNNGGQPFPPLETADAMGTTPGSSRFQTILSSSLRYTLTTGNYKSDRIGLTSVGNAIVAPVSEEARTAALMQAALSPPTFKAAYDYFKGKKLPEGEFLVNTFVREFKVPKEDAERCANIFRANMKFVGLIRKISGSDWVSTEAQTHTIGTVSGDDQLDADVKEMESSLGAVSAPEGPTTPAPPGLTLASPPSPEPEQPKAIFIGHGSDKTAVNQLVKILNELGLPHKVAEYEANAGRPISQKVSDLMSECGAAILVFTADRELQDKEGNPVWLSSHNVANELGAAYVKYNGRVVIFKETSVDLASNYSGIGYIEFEKGKLQDKAMELFREIRQFGLIKISIGE